jgi:molybdopterin converting factor small subunit
MVNIKYRAQLANLIGAGGEAAAAEQVKDVLRFIKDKHGAAAEKTARTMLIAVNGESILHLKMYKTGLRAGDEVSFLPICGGG